MREQFYVSLPSDSSSAHFPDNTTTRFRTKLPRYVELAGEWSVALTELQYPLTFAHVSNAERTPVVDLMSQSSSRDLVKFPWTTEGRFEIATGNYASVADILGEINRDPALSEHVRFATISGNRTVLARECSEASCAGTHGVRMSKCLQQILGFRCAETEIIVQDAVATHPASLHGGMPKTMFVYSDVCDSHLTGDVQTPLLRAVPVNADNYRYGSMRTCTLSNPYYFPVAMNSFCSIEVDIRDHVGKPILFEEGTSIATLHFRRED